MSHLDLIRAWKGERFLLNRLANRLIRSLAKGTREFGPSLPLAATLLAAVTWPAMTFAATTTGSIAVLDFTLGTQDKIIPIDTLNSGTSEVKGALTVFVDPPFDPNGKLDLTRIHGTPPKPQGCSDTSTSSESIDLKVHGSSSRYHPKKSYSLDFKRPVCFLGMPEETEWILHSCWADKTCLRNVMGYWFAEKLFPWYVPALAAYTNSSWVHWAPRTEFVEVFINGDYLGLYVAIEKIKLSPGRVNLPAPSGDTLNSATLSGTYIIKRDGGDRDFDWQSTVDSQKGNYPGTNWWFVSPKKKNLNEAQQNYIKDYMNFEFEPTFNPSDFIYQAKKYYKWVDERSAVDFVILQEIANNVDAYWKSMHLTKAQSFNGDFGKIYMGPIWDLDLAFANYYETEQRNVCEWNRWRMEKSQEENVAANFNATFQPLREMWKISSFQQAMRNRWADLRYNATISRTQAENQIDAFAARIASARARDNGKWDTLGKRTWAECWNKPTYQEEVTELKKWIRERITWMDKQLL